MSSFYSAVEPLGASASSFQILARIAKGGMAELFLARAATGGGVARHVVLKRVTRDRAHDYQFLQMFLDEARLAAQLQHPNIAQVYDVGKLGDSYFFTMEYVHGETVRSIVQLLADQHAAMPVVCALTIAAGATAGLHHAHERIGVDGRPLGIVHRDVSPSNLMVSFEGNVKVVDFGVAQTSTNDHETISGTVKGKISYLSPEQATGAAIDRRSDIFSLGIVLWEMLTGRRLYKRSSDFESMVAVVSESVAPPSSIRADVPAAVDAIVLRALAKDRHDRFESAHEMHEAIEATAAAIGQALSVAALARFVRELYGPRPEPWIALERPSGNASFITLTAEPIPPELVIPAATPVDLQLATVIDLETFGSLAPTARRVAVEASDAPQYAASEPQVEPAASAPARRMWRWPAIAVAVTIPAGIALALVLLVPSPEYTTVASVLNATGSDASVALAEPEPPPGLDPVEVEEDEPDPARGARPPSDRELATRCANGRASRKPVACTLAACRLRDVEQARAWFAGVPASQRVTISTQCRVSGVEVAPND